MLNSKSEIQNPKSPKLRLGYTAIISVALLAVVALTQLIAFAWKIIPATIVHVETSSSNASTQNPTALPAPPAPPIPEAPQSEIGNPKPINDPAENHRAMALIAEAEQAQRLGQWETVIARVEQAMSMIGPNPQLRFQRAFAMERLGMESKALHELDKLRLLPNLDPVLSANIDKLAQRIRVTLANVSALGLVPSAPADLPPAEDTKPLIDDFGLPPGAALGLVDVRETVEESTHRRLRIAIKKRPDLNVEAPDVKVHVQFFEKSSRGDIVPTSSQVRSEWISPPIDWSDNDPEILDVIYHGPLKSDDDPHPNEYFGYLVGVYYGDELQDSKATPPILERKFPLPLFLSSDQ